MEFNELNSPTLKDLFIKEIEEKILSGELAIGEKLPNERELSTKMHVSRAVINGGITELESKGFLEVVPRKGAYVADYKSRGNMDTLSSVLKYNGDQFDPTMLDSIREVRICLEREIAELAAQNRTENDLGRLQRHLEKLEEITDVKELSEENFEFYHSVALASGNVVFPLLLSGFRSMYEQLMQALYRCEPMEKRTEMLCSLVNLIEEQMPKEAGECVVEVINLSHKCLEQHYLPGQSYKSQAQPQNRAEK